MNKYTCFYCYNVSNTRKLGVFVVNARTRFGAIIKATRICKRFPKWSYLNCMKEVTK